MGLSVEEKLMYEVMHALYDSGIPISFKGSMVLKACLLEAGYTEETRHTVDIDANWYADVPPSDEMIRASLQEVIDNKVIRKHKEKRRKGVFRRFRHIQMGRRSFSSSNSAAGQGSGRRGRS